MPSSGSIGRVAFTFLALSFTPAQAQAVSLQSGTATFTQTACGSYSPDHVYDGVTTGPNGWAIAVHCGPPGDAAVANIAAFETAVDVNASQLQFLLTQGSSQHLIGRFRLSVTTDDRATFCDGLDNGGDVGANWTVLSFPVVTSGDAVTFTVLPDHSILVAGSATSAVYDVRYSGSFVGVTGIRLEVLEEPSLPYGGPGMQPTNGNFILLELGVNASIAPSEMKLLAPVVLGLTSSIVIEHPPELAGRQFAMAMCSPSYPGTLPISIPGVARGTLRLDPLAYGVLGIGVLDASGVSPAFTFQVPNDPLLIGASFDVQGADVDPFGFITLTDNDLEIVVGDLDLVAIAPGTFQMGSPVTPLNVAPYFNQANAQPVHSVTITQPFWMGKYEVTQSEFQMLMSYNPSQVPGGSRPVQANWYQAVAYCDALTVQEAAAGRIPSGYEFRLPTEAEWEFCCRAGTTTEFHTGSSLNCLQAKFSGCGGTVLNNVGSFAANAWGLHDMHGNVREWCLDSWDGSANYPAGSVADPYVTVGSFRVVRGGGWNSSNASCRSAYRAESNNPFNPTLPTGFRVVCAPILP